MENAGGTKKINPLIWMNVFVFLIALGEGIVTPIIPLYADKIGASYSQLGLLITGYGLGYIALTLAAGRFSDIFGRRKILLVGVFLGLLAAIIYTFASSVELILLGKITEGMSRGIIYPLAAVIIVDKTTVKSRNSALGNLTACYGAGFALGSISGGYLAQAFELTSVFPVYIVFGVTVLAVAWFNIFDGPKQITIGQRQKTTTFWGLLSELKGILPFAYVGFTYAGFLWTITALQSKIAEIAGFTPFVIGIFFFALWTARIITALSVGRFVARVGRRRMVFAGLICCLLATMVFPISQSFIFILLASILTGLGTGALYPIIVSLVADNISAKHRGMALGFLETAMGLGVVQPYISGIIGEYVGLKSAYLSCMLTILICLVVVFIWVKEKESKIQIGEMQIDEPMKL